MIDTIGGNASDDTSNTCIVDKDIARYYQLEDRIDDNDDDNFGAAINARVVLKYSRILTGYYQIDFVRHIADPIHVKSIFDEDDVFTITVPLVERRGGVSLTLAASL